MIYEYLLIWLNPLQWIGFTPPTLMLGPNALYVSGCFKTLFALLFHTSFEYEKQKKERIYNENVTRMKDMYYV